MNLYFNNEQMVYSNKKSDMTWIIKQKYIKYIKMQISSQQEIKKKTKDFIKIYQKQLIKKQSEKQKIKSNIMLDIMSKHHNYRKQCYLQNNYHQNQQSFNNYINQNNQIFIGVYGSENYQLDQHKNFYFECQRSTSVPNVLENSQIYSNQELNKVEKTFKVSKNKEQCQIQPFRKLEMGMKQNYYFYDENMDETQTLRSQKIPQKHSPITPIQIQDNSYQQNQQRKQKQQILKKQDNQIHLLKQIKNKGLAFDIINNNSKILDNMDEIKRKKIQEFQRKRQLRIQQYRKQQQSKQRQRKTNRSLLKTNSKPNQYAHHQAKQNIMPLLPKQRNIKSKRQQFNNEFYLNNKNANKQQSINQCYILNANVSHISQHQFEGTKTAHLQFKNNKSKVKTNRTRQLSTKNQRSTSKYTQQPKIQPKQRKNTYLRQSNKKLMINALTNVCLPGELNRKQREKFSQIIQSNESQFLVFLFKQYSKKLIKAIYLLDISQKYLQKVYGDKIPDIVSPNMVQSFYRFDSGAKQFKQLDGCKSFSFAVHAFDLL